MTGKELRKRRRAIDLTQVQLAEELGLSPNTVSRYETQDLVIPKAVELAIEALEARAERQAE